MQRGDCAACPNLPGHVLQRAGASDGCCPNPRVTMGSLSGRLAASTVTLSWIRVCVCVCVCVRVAALVRCESAVVFRAGLQTSQNAKFYAISGRFDSFSNRDSSLVVQFTVKHEQKIDCGGGYVKVLQKSTMVV